MSSPEVWDDARDRIEAAAAQLGLPVAWPNEAFDDPPPYDAEGQPHYWLAVEISGDTSDPIELDGIIWQEVGMVHLHILVPTGSGIRQGLMIRKTLANTFRNVPGGFVLYPGAIMDPLGPVEGDGNWAQLTLRIPYRYQDSSAPE